jgi:hypothetical protein
MSILDGVAYGERFDSATATLRLEGLGARFDTVEVLKAGGRGEGAAFVGWDGSYSFNFDGARMRVEDVQLTEASGLPLSGVLAFAAEGTGTFDAPRYQVRGTVQDFFVGDEGVGEVLGTIAVTGDVLTLNVEAASPRLAVSGTGRILLTPDREADLTFIVADTSLDPYVREFEPRLSPFITAVAGGNVRVTGPLLDVDRVRVDATIERVDMTFFDYAVRNDSPVRLAFDQHAVRIDQMRLVGRAPSSTCRVSSTCTTARWRWRPPGSPTWGSSRASRPTYAGRGRHGSRPRSRATWPTRSSTARSRSTTVACATSACRTPWRR